MTEQRVVILDASHSLFTADDPLSMSNLKGKNVVRPPPTTEDDVLGLQPIPGFAEIVMDSIRDVASTGTLGKVAPVDVGVVCDASAVRALGKVIHDRVRARLKL